MIYIVPFPQQINQLLSHFIEQSNDGYAIFDAAGGLIYSNYVYRDIFCLEKQQPDQRKTFVEMVKNADQQKRGIRLFTGDIDEWLLHVETLRGKRKFRSFEVDLVDGRRLLFSEQVLGTGELLIQTQDITRQKVLQIELKNSVSELQKSHVTDELTDIANRRYFVQSAELELNRCKRNSAAVTLLLLDLDHFKEVNNTYGHAAGDSVLVHVAGILKKTLRQYDVLGRIGGEVFAILLSTTDIDTANKIALRILQDVEQSSVEYVHQYIKISTSIGMASRDCMVSFDQLYIEAEEALQRAKDAGRNRVELYK